MFFQKELLQVKYQNGISFYDLRAHQGTLRNLIIRNSTTGELMVIVVFAFADKVQIKMVMNYLQESFPQITSLLYIENQKKNDIRKKLTIMNNYKKVQNSN